MNCLPVSASLEWWKMASLEFYSFFANFSSFWSWYEIFIWTLSLSIIFRIIMYLTVFCSKSIFYFVFYFSTLLSYLVLLLYDLSNKIVLNQLFFLCKATFLFFFFLSLYFILFLDGSLLLNPKIFDPLLRVPVIPLSCFKKTKLWRIYSLLYIIVWQKDLTHKFLIHCGQFLDPVSTNNWKSISRSFTPLHFKPCLNKINSRIYPLTLRNFL